MFTFMQIKQFFPLIYSFLSIGILFSNPIFADNILIGKFTPHASEKNSEIENQIYQSLKKELSQKGYTVLFTKENQENIFQNTKSSENKFYLEGQYTKTKSEPLSIYIQVYNPSTGKIIDAMSESLNLKSIEGVELDPKEINRSNEEIIELISKQVAIDLELNPEKKESRENIQDHLISKPIYKKGIFSISQSDTKEEARQAFKLIEEQTVISSTKTKTSLNRAPNVISLISDKEIKDYGRVSLNDILYQLPGFSPSQSNERRLVSFRGVYEGWNNNHLLMLVDGVQHNDLFYGSALTWEITPLNMIKSLEVIRGPGSALYGSNATNGVISLNTYSGSDLNGALNLRVRMGDYGTKIYDLVTGNKGKMFSHVVSFNSYETNGNNYVNYDSSERKDAFGFLVKFPHQDERNSYYLFAKLEGEENLKGLSFQYHRQKWNYQTFDGWLQNVPDMRDKQMEYRDIFITKYTKNITNKLSHEYVMRYSYNGWDYNYRALPNSDDYPSGVTENLKTKIDNLFLRAQLTYSFSNGGALVAGVEGNRLFYKKDSTHNSNINMNLLGDQSPNPDGVFLPLNPFMEWIVDRPILKIAPFAQLTSGKLFGNKVEFTAGIRYDETSMHFRGIDQPYKNWIGTPEITMTDPNTDTSTTYAIPSQYLGAPFVTNEKKVYRRTTPRGGIVYFFSNKLTFKFMVGRAFREPAPGELFGVNTYVGGSNNPRSINPELIKTSDLVVDWIINSNFTLRTNLFQTRFENAIGYLTQNNTIANTYTIGTRGIESEFLVSFKYISAFVNYSRFYRFSHENLDSATSKHPKEVTQAPSQTGNIGLSAFIGKWTSSISLQSQSAVRRSKSDLGNVDPLTGHLTYNENNDPNSYTRYRPTAAPTWTNINFRVSYNITSNMHLGIYITNLSNSYQTLIVKDSSPTDYIREGRRVMIDFQASF